MSNQSQIFATTINELGSFGMLGRSDCDNFGMTWGCRTHCPTFQSGNCTEPAESIEQFIRLNEFDDEDSFLNALSAHEDSLSENDVDFLFEKWFEKYN